MAGCAQSEQPGAALTQSQRVRLERFIAASKFKPDNLYVGYLSRDVIADPDAILNGIAQRLLRQRTFTKDCFLDDATRTLLVFDEADTEDRERAYASVERLMDILGIASSDGRLNKGLYGFDPAAGASKP